MERKAEQSKKRFVSYSKCPFGSGEILTPPPLVFHEVRVPLNTALLAVQNLKGEGVFSGLDDDMDDMVHGLMGSLTMMEKAGTAWKYSCINSPGPKRCVVFQPNGERQVCSGRPPVRFPQEHSAGGHESSASNQRQWCPAGG